MSTIVDRGYVLLKGNAMVPTWTAFAVITLLEKHFPELVDYAFTARMEDDLDGIANGSRDSVPWLHRFYFGAADDATEVGLHRMVSENLGEIDARAVNSIPIGRDASGQDIVVRVGKFGPYVQRGEETATVPETVAPDELTVEKAVQILSAPSGGRVVGTDPKTKLPVLVRAGRFGAYVQLGEAGDKDDEKPKTASLLSTMTPDAVTLEDALLLLSLPRSLGRDPKDGEEVVAQNGRYGPYVQKGKESRSLASEGELFSVDLSHALNLLAQPKLRGQRRAAAGPLKELGVDPTSQKPIVLREGKFGLYVTDGETNATLGKADSVEGISPERAQELLSERRERGPSPKAARRAKATTKKAAAGEGSAKPAKKAAKKTAKKATKKSAEA
jgi:DNA topoisomerase I